jgi:hypothetical protein
LRKLDSSIQIYSRKALNVVVDGLVLLEICGSAIRTENITIPSNWQWIIWGSG